MTITVDTSVFIELLLDQDRAEESESLLDAIGKGRVAAVVSHFTVHAIEAMLPTQQSVSMFLKDVDTSKGLAIYDTTIADEQSISILSGKIGLDFDDSVQFYVAKRTNSSSIVSFDRHFDACGIPRREPIQILKDLGKKTTPEGRSREDAQSEA